MIYPIILCGGSGSRLWPSSRKSFPKQFSALMGPDSLYQATLKRVSAPGFAAPMVLTGQDFRFMATDQAAAIGLQDAVVLVEPVGRNTGPAVLTAALKLADQPDAVMMVTASDHAIGDVAEFQAVARVAADLARTGRLVCIGIKPTRAETGYGYLELTGAVHGTDPQPVVKFCEKPDQARAEAFFRSGMHLWNASIFLFRVRDILEAFKTHAPDLLAPCKAALDEGKHDLNFFRLGEAYEQARDISLDYAVMEHSDMISAVPYGGGWSDLGSWDALWESLVPDEDGVATTGPVTAIDCSRTLLRSEEDNLHLVGLGLKNIVAVAMRDAVLVADMDASQRVREVVDLLKVQSAPQAEDFPRFHRPWGWYETLCLADRFQVKRIMVHPGGVLSLQSHMHRAEHWVVVAGTARVTIGEDVRLMAENQSIYIPLGAKHRLENPGKVDMYLIEVQTGSYLGEDDIMRYEDIYARASDE